MPIVTGSSGGFRKRTQYVLRTYVPRHVTIVSYDVPIHFLVVFPRGDAWADVMRSEFEFELRQPLGIDREPANDSGKLCHFLASSQEKW